MLSGFLVLLVILIIRMVYKTTNKQPTEQQHLFLCLCVSVTYLSAAVSLTHTLSHTSHSLSLSLTHSLTLSHTLSLLTLSPPRCPLPRLLPLLLPPPRGTGKVRHRAVQVRRHPPRQAPRPLFRPRAGLRRQRLRRVPPAAHAKAVVHPGAGAVSTGVADESQVERQTPAQAFIFGSLPTLQSTLFYLCPFEAASLDPTSSPISPLPPRLPATALLRGPRYPCVTNTCRCDTDADVYVARGPSPTALPHPPAHAQPTHADRRGAVSPALAPGRAVPPHDALPQVIHASPTSLPHAPPPRPLTHPSPHNAYIPQYGKRHPKRPEQLAVQRVHRGPSYAILTAPLSLPAPM
jgi:hypothetical protein